MNDSTFFEKHLVAITHLRNIARGFILEMQEAARVGDSSRAIATGLNIIKLANAVRRGGLVVDMLAAMAIELVAINHLRRFRPKLIEVKGISNAILDLEIERESYEDVMERDDQWRKAVGWVDRAVTEWPVRPDGMGEADEQQKQLDSRNVALLRLLAIDIAVAAYESTKNVLPDALADTVPEFLREMPLDPFTSEYFKYRRLDKEFILYSTGPSGVDLGGCGGHWCAVQTGQANLGLDSFDY